MKKPTILTLLLLACGFTAHSQILHAENFNVILDSTRFIKGSLVPSFRYRNVKEPFVEIENTSDISVKLGQNGFTVANRFEYARSGDEDIISGGFVYLEYRRVTDTNQLVVEPYGMMVWQGIRGLDMKYAAGSNLRYRIFMRPETGIFTGIGAFYEYERWNYSGTADTTLIPDNPEPVVAENIRGSLYISLKKSFGDLFDLDVSAYYQPRFVRPLENYRLAVSAQITYNFNRFIGLTVLYQNIYDPDPLVPIDRLFNDLNLGLTLSF